MNSGQQQSHPSTRKKRPKKITLPPPTAPILPISFPTRIDVESIENKYYNIAYSTTPVIAPSIRQKESWFDYVKKCFGWK